jgi:hypothetical protein
MRVTILVQKTDTEVDIVLDKTITIFRYLAEKDAFERYYKGHLAKRLLLGRSVSEDAERGMLAKLKVESGYQFTQKLEGMFNDMKLSAETMQAYRRHLDATTVRFYRHAAHNSFSLTLLPLILGSGNRTFCRSYDVDVLAHVSCCHFVQFSRGNGQGQQIL